MKNRSVCLRIWRPNSTPGCVRPLDSTERRRPAGGSVLICRRRGDQSLGPALLMSCPTPKFRHYPAGFRLASRASLCDNSAARAMQEQVYPKHYCGVFGIFGHPNAAELAYYGLYALQHRGQESAGIVTCHDGKFFKHHGMGLVSQVFNPRLLHDLVGNMAIGHTRYSTTGTSNLRNAQPLTVDCTRGQIAIAHNGNLTNAAQLRDELENHGLVFQTKIGRASCR